MKRFLIFFIIIIAIIIIAARQGCCKDIGFIEDPISIGIGAKPISLGRAGVAGINEGLGIFVNPADMSENKVLTLSSMYSSFLGGDVTYSVVGIGFPFLKDTVLGFGYVSSNVEGIITPTQEGFNFTNYENNVILIGLSRQNNDLSIGGTFKLFRQGFSGYINHIGSGQDLDIGVKYKFNKSTVFGVNFRNILPAAFGGKVAYPNGTEQGIPAIAKAGLSFKAGGLLLFSDYNLELDRTYYPSTLHFGAEWLMNPLFLIRGGVDQNLSAATGGVESNPTFGVGLNLANLKIDYAYHPYFKETSNVTHFVSLRYLGTQKIEKAEKVETAITVEAKSAEAWPATTSIEVEKPVKSSRNLTETGYHYVQLGIFSLKSNADGLTQRLKEKGFDAQNEFSGKYYKVFIPAYTLSEARKINDSIRKLGFETTIK